MRALVQNGFGTIETMEEQELPIPEIENRMVLIQVKAISINPVDVDAPEQEVQWLNI